MALNKAQLMDVPGGPGIVGAVQQGTGISIVNGVISATTASSTTPPAAPQTGQLWYDTATNPFSLKVWDGSQWVPVGGGVTSVTVTGTNGITTTGSPITTAGTITASLNIAGLLPLP
jgi:hypothetical protein